MSRTSRNLFCPMRQQCVNCLCKCPCRIDQIIENNGVFTVYIPDQMEGFSLIRSATPLVDNGYSGSQPLGKGAGPFHTPCVRTYNYRFSSDGFFKVVDQNWHAVEVIHWYIEK